MSHENGDPIEQGPDGKWYWYDEVWATKYGPYDSKVLAELECLRYAREELDKVPYQEQHIGSITNIKNKAIELALDNGITAQWGISMVEQAISVGYFMALTDQLKTNMAELNAIKKVK